MVYIIVKETKEILKKIKNDYKKLQKNQISILKKKFIL